MADSVDRVFVHALNTVKKIPKTGASRPPPSERLRLYGLYKQAMEGDVDGVMEQPMASAGLSAEELQRERDKWDAWNCQKGISRTEAKRRYIEALIETMHRYATTADGRELVSELEFVWNQIKHNSPSASDSSPQAAPLTRRFAQPLSGSDGPMKVLSPMSEQDEAELRSQRQMDLEDREMGHDVSIGSGRSQRKMERAITKLSAEVAALREQITTGREWKAKKERSFPSWLGWLVWSIMKHLLIDCVILSLILVWMRRRKDRRLEDLVRAALTLVLFSEMLPDTNPAVLRTCRVFAAQQQGPRPTRLCNGKIIMLYDMDQAVFRSNTRIRALPAILGSMPAMPFY
ncbi:hypothetical protein NQ176_g5031 [Zarea fungicola]|uniref:Uncharacterized protein n=1 Tax=Zarea fungicola TaxID=93591 RepID=A0ACC1NBA3_9HYPO|nr:hypothetical protein NQ176_g5031 [Lecanicillium fungicola]